MSNHPVLRRKVKFHSRQSSSCGGIGASALPRTENASNGDCTPLEMFQARVSGNQNDNTTCNALSDCELGLKRCVRDEPRHEVRRVNCLGSRGYRNFMILAVVAFALSVVQLFTALPPSLPRFQSSVLLISFLRVAITLEKSSFAVLSLSLSHTLSRCSTTASSINVFLLLRFSSSVS